MSTKPNYCIPARGHSVVLDDLLHWELPTFCKGKRPSYIHRVNLAALHSTVALESAEHLVRPCFYDMLQGDAVSVSVHLFVLINRIY